MLDGVRQGNLGPKEAMACTDFVLNAKVEIDGENNMSFTATMEALLEARKNPRRCLLTEVTLCSDHTRCTDFVMVQGADLLCSKDLTRDEVDWCLPLSTSTDFVVFGEAETEGDSDVSLSTAAARTALLSSGGYYNPRRTLLKRVGLSSNNSRCSDFFVRSDAGVRCSKLVTNEDLARVERELQAKPGTLFKAVRSEAPSTTELPWEPVARFKALAKQTRFARKVRGAKPEEHLLNNRRSDPTINLSGWLDWRALNERAESSRMAKPLKLQRLKGSDSAAASEHCLRTMQKAHEKAPHEVAPPAMGSRTKEIREERKSADSVMSFLDEAMDSENGAVPTSPSSILVPEIGQKVTMLGKEPWLLEKGAKVKPGDVVWFEGRPYSKGTETGYSSS